jgi:hypothetical protein
MNKVQNVCRGQPARCQRVGSWGREAPAVFLVPMQSGGQTRLVFLHINSMIKPANQAHLGQGALWFNGWFYLADINVDIRPISKPIGKQTSRFVAEERLSASLSSPGNSSSEIQAGSLRSA